MRDYQLMEDHKVRNINDVLGYLYKKEEAELAARVTEMMRHMMYIEGRLEQVLADRDRDISATLIPKLENRNG